MNQQRTVETTQRMPFPARPQPEAERAASDPPPSIAMSPRGTPGHPAFARISRTLRERAKSAEEVQSPTLTSPPPPPPAAPSPRPTVIEQGTVAEPQVKVLAEIDSNYVTITDLPSRFVFYTFDKLSIRTIRAADQAKLNRAMAEGSMRHMVEALSATLGDGVSAYALTPEDFRFLQYWHRLNSYTKVPYEHTDYCDGVEHLEKVSSGQLAPETLEIKTILLKTSLTTKELDTETLNTSPLPDSLSQLGNVHLSVCTMEDVVSQMEFLESVVKAHPDDVGIREEYEWMSDFALYLGPKSVPLADRVEVIKTLSADQIQDFSDYMGLVGNYGVQESTTITCKVCGASKRSQISIDALSFLPVTQRTKHT